MQKERSKKKVSKKKEIVTELSVYGLDGKVVGSIQLDKELFDGKVNKVLLYEANKMYEDNKRHGTVSTKNRSEVAGGGVKPWRQKGTGRARVGSIRNPLWRHGGVVFGPEPRDHSFAIPKKAARKALLSSLNVRLNENMVKGIVKITLDKPKTKEFQTILDNLKLEGKTLIVVDGNDQSVTRSSRNIADVTLKEARNINARDVLLNNNVIIEKEAFEKLTARLR